MLLLRCLFILIICAPVWAAEEAPIPAVDPVSSTYLVKITLGLAFIVTLIFVLAWLAKKMQLAPGSGQQSIRVLSAISVGHRDRIALVEVGEDQILISLTPGRIQKLHTLTSKVVVDQSGTAASPAFSDRLQRLMQPGKTQRGIGDDA